MDGMGEDSFAGRVPYFFLILGVVHHHFQGVLYGYVIFIHDRFPMGPRVYIYINHMKD